MFLRSDETNVRSAAWRISLWGTLAFALGTIIIFIFLHRFLSYDIQRRSDAWLSGEVEVLGDIAERTPKDALYSRVLVEVAELVRKEIPNRNRSDGSASDSVFFLQTSEDGSLKLWAGASTSEKTLKAIRESGTLFDLPSDLHVNGIAIPFRVVSIPIEDGSRIYLGFSERDQLRVLNNLRLRFLLLWLLIVLLGFAMVFVTTRGMLNHVQEVTESASRIGRSDLNRRVPTTERKDEVAHLALTLNSMLDRIESSMHQLHTITDSLAHDLRSPLTAIRGKLEMLLSSAANDEQIESIVSVMEEVDLLTDYLNQSLDVAEAKADALRLARTSIDLDELLKSMVDLYRPSLAEKGLQVTLRSAGSVIVEGDAALIHRLVGNLFDNELKHLPAAGTVTIQLRANRELASLRMEDDGPGFAPDVLNHLFESRVKGKESSGHGLGLAFVDAVTRAHGGAVTASNREEGGAMITITLPLTSSACSAERPATKGDPKHASSLSFSLK
jgi:signal transduction histidine kinase